MTLIFKRVTLQNERQQIEGEVNQEKREKKRKNDYEMGMEAFKWTISGLVT